MHQVVRSLFDERRDFLQKMQYKFYESIPRFFCAF